jgi:hypothetical protein
MHKKYSIFGAGAAGLYTAWRLLSGETDSVEGKEKQLQPNDVLELYDWGKYDFDAHHTGTRAAGARICTWHYNNEKEQSYLELGGMRYAQWDEVNKSGHLLVSTVIEALHLSRYAIPFNESSNPLFYLRRKHLYLNDISPTNPAPYNIPNGGAAQTPFAGMNTVSKLGVSGKMTRKEWCEFYQHGRINQETPPDSVFQKGEQLKNIGYWNLMYDQLDSEGYDYCADGNGYSSNVINWNSADAFEANNEFTPGTQYRTLKEGYSMMFNALFQAIILLAKEKGVHFHYHPDTRLHSILSQHKAIEFTIAKRETPWHPSSTHHADAAWLAMPRHSIELVAQATRYHQHDKGTVDILNANKVKNYLAAAIMQPSYKIGLFFTEDWWKDATFKPLLDKNSIGPSYTDTPIRMVVYFGNNALKQFHPPVYGILASYDDEMFTDFWKEMELELDEERTIPDADNIQPLVGPRKCTKTMIQMLRKQLAELHFGAGASLENVPEPLEARYIDWSLPPFNAGYHAWAAHYDIGDVQRKIRKPSQLVEEYHDAPIFIVGEAYSNDQAWVEGAFCTAESVLNDFFHIKPFVHEPEYPFICPP